MSDVAIGPMAPSELWSVLDLLERLGLPEAGLAEHASTVLVARADGRVVGTAALEVYGDEALLRSVGVEPEHQGAGLGGELTQEALSLARRLGVRRIYLLTTTAERFFPRFGFGADRSRERGGIRAAVRGVPDRLSGVRHRHGEGVVKRANPTIALLLRILADAYDKRGWQGPSLKGSLRGVTPRQAAFRPGPGRHSIRELTLHAAYWKYAVWRRLTGVKRGSFPLDGSNWFARPGVPQLSEWRKDQSASRR